MRCEYSASDSVAARMRCASAAGLRWRDRESSGPTAVASHGPSALGVDLGQYHSSCIAEAVESLSFAKTWVLEL